MIISLSETDRIMKEIDKIEIEYFKNQSIRATKSILNKRNFKQITFNELIIKRIINKKIIFINTFC